MSKRVFTEKDIAEWLAAGKAAADLPAGAILTPAARDRLQESGNRGGKPGVVTGTASKRAVVGAAPVLPDYVYRWEERPDPVGDAAIQAFFHSAEIEVLKERMCEMGRRMWQKDYTDGNGGNMVIRVGENLFLTTQTLISKGFMTPETIALVDWDGRQLAGRFKRTSECMTHLAIYRKQPKARATCHAHPPHATAFAVANVQPPTCMIPEAEVFLGQIGMSPYQTPGSPANAEEVGKAAEKYQAILMVNHGVITWGDHIEDAYWKMENTDAYCKTIWIASQLGNGLKTITGGQAKELIRLRESLGMSDFRANLKECELCDNSDFRPGVVCSNLPAGGDKVAGVGSKDEADALVRQITDLIMAELNK